MTISPGVAASAASAPQWYAVKTKPRAERQTEAVLSQRGVDVYIPYIPSLRSGRRRPNPKSAPLEPLFPGYLFSRIALGTPEWIAARSAPGVAYFLGSGGAPMALPDELIQTIRTRVEAQQQRTPEPPFKRGEWVLVERGPFSGIEAVFDKALSPAGRVRVLLEIVGRLVPLELDFDFLSRGRLSKPAVKLAS